MDRPTYTTQSFNKKEGILLHPNNRLNAWNRADVTCD